MKNQKPIQSLSTILLACQLCHSTAQQGAVKTECPDLKHPWKITLTTDSNPIETTWELRNGKGRVVASNSPEYEKQGTYEHTACLKPGTFTFEIRDSGQDGLCCNNGDGGYVLTLDEDVIREINGNQTFDMEQFQFDVVDKTSTSTTEIPTSAPQNEIGIDEDWSDFDYTHSKFCGPKIVGGYDVAIAQCKPSTKCGLSSKQNQYGSSGNDCPPGLMCYADISCRNGPGATTSEIEATEFKGSSNSGKVTVSEVNTAMITSTRGSYCGKSYKQALENCSPNAHCSTDDDCISGTCFSDISCTYSGDVTSINGGNETGDDGFIVSSMMQDVTSLGSKSEIGHLLWFVLGLSAFLI